MKIVNRKVLIEELAKAIPDASIGLGKDFFEAISRLTPIVNVDLLIQKVFHGKINTLLAWRSDDLYLGWHLPGGVLRFKETLDARVLKVAKEELLSSIASIKGPLEINEIFNENRDIRGHFLSFLYSVELDSYPEEMDSFSQNKIPSPGTLRWFVNAPSDLLKQHALYGKYFKK